MKPGGGLNPVQNSLHYSSRVDQTTTVPRQKWSNKGRGGIPPMGGKNRQPLSVLSERISNGVSFAVYMRTETDTVLNRINAITPTRTKLPRNQESRRE